MPDSTKLDWEQLEKDCRECSLPKPILKPTGSEGKEWFKIYIGEFGRHSGTSLHHVIHHARRWVHGYKVRMVTEANATEAEPKLLETPESMMDFACVTAQSVINNDGHSGPEDHILLAKAVLAICTTYVLEHPKDHFNQGY